VFRNNPSYIKESVDIPFSKFKFQEVTNERREELIPKGMKPVFFFCRQGFTGNSADLGPRHH